MMFGTMIGGYSLPARRFEAVVETLPQARHCRVVSVDRNAHPLSNHIATQIIDAMNVVSMRMGIDRRIDALDAGSNHLVTEVRSGVHYDGRLSTVRRSLFNQQRSTPATIFGV